MLVQKNIFAQAEELRSFSINATTMNEAILDTLSEIPEVISLASDILLSPPRITLYADGNILDAATLTSYLAAINAAYGCDLTVIDSQKITPTDWVKHAQQETPLMVIGDIVVAGSHHDPASLPHNKKPLWMDAGAAFGTGEHATTAGCLQAFCALLRHERPRHIVDMGCGTALLGMAAAALVPSAYVTVTDNDPVAVKVAAENIRRNHLHTRMEAFTAQGFTHPRFYGKHYDVILANILAHPIRAMAGAMQHHTRTGGTVILSGFYQRDARLVYAQFYQRGFRLQQMLKSKEWAVLILKKH
jgi:ribosomal protein L11 methyltransferase